MKLQGDFGGVTPVFFFGGLHWIRTTRGKGFAGIAYYPIDNLELRLSGYDVGGISGARAGVEYLLPQMINGAATTIALNGSVGNHGTSSLMTKLKFMFGTGAVNNKTLIERRRQDD